MAIKIDLSEGNALSDRFIVNTMRLSEGVYIIRTCFCSTPTRISQCRQVRTAKSPDILSDLTIRDVQGSRLVAQI